MIVFARPRHHYDSYMDMYRLIDVSGFPSVYFDEIDPASDNVYIMTVVNGENMHGWSNPKAEIILWDLEWRLDSPAQIPGVSRVWASDRWYASQIGAEYVTLGSHPLLADTEPVDPDTLYDVAAMMYVDPYRRSNLLNRLRGQGIRIAPPAYGQHRHRRLRQSRAMLHIHQHDNVSTIAPLRWALAAAYRLPVVSEIAADPYPFHNRTIWLGYETMGNRLSEYLADDHALQDYGVMLHEFLCREQTFRIAVEAAL